MVNREADRCSSAAASAVNSRPRMRRCLLKGCEQRFHPRQARQHYCSQSCREAARQWSRWKAQQRYRATRAGQHKRSGQSRRYRERVKSRKPPQPSVVKEAGRVITTEHFFRSKLRPARVLRGIPKSASKSVAALLFARVQARDGARPGTGTAVEEGVRFSPEILIASPARPYIQAVECNWSFTSSSGAGST